MVVSASQPKLPVINMDDLKTGSESWILRCQEVTHALEEYGCFMAIYDGVSKELNKEVFESLKPLFDLPIDTKIKNTSHLRVFGYLGPTHTRPLFQSMGIENVTSLDHVHHFANLMWPFGNRPFSEMIHSYANQVSELENMVKQMVFQHYGVEKYYESYDKSTMTYLLRANKYIPPNANELNVATTAVHTDRSFLSILSQNHVKGLEVQTRDDRWLSVEFMPSSFIVMAADGFMAWSNGRLRSAPHRVTMNGQEDRYSIGLFTFKKGVIEIPEELVDEEHPSKFKPFNHFEFVDHMCKSPLYIDERAIKLFCGI